MQFTLGPDTKCLQCTLWARGREEEGNVWRHTAQRHFRPFTMECNFVPHRRNNLRDRLPLCLPLPVLRNAIKISDGVATPRIYAYPSWTSVRRESGNDNVQLPRKHYARLRLCSIRATECVSIKFFPKKEIHLWDDFEILVASLEGQYFFASIKKKRKRDKSVCYNFIIEQ